MSITLEDFIRSLADCGLMDAEEVQSFITTLPMEQQPRTAEKLAREMYRAGKLTKFQAQAIYQKKTRGLVVGNYVVLDKLGKGGMGEVYKAQHRRMKRVVALKMLPSSATKSPESVKRFQREVEAAAKLSHPNIVTAHDADEAKGVHFLVMEYVDGQDLASLVKEKGPLPLPKAVDYVIQAAKGLEYAHRQGIIHRDIKPSNLLLDQTGTVKILDMGLARIEETIGPEKGGLGEELTRSGEIMGTLDYMSPEQALDTKTADARADIYSLGCTLYALVAGKPPYGGDTLAKKIFAHKEQPIPSLRAEGKGVPESLDAVFQRMVAKRPEERQQSMTEVIADLQKCVLVGEEKAHRPPVSPIAYDETLSFRQEQLADTQPPPPPLSPLDELFLEQPIQFTERLLAPRRRSILSRISKQQKMMIAVMVGAALLAVLLGVIINLRTPEGTLVVEITEPDVTVQVLDQQGKILIQRKAQKGTFSIGVDPGKRRLRLEKDGVELFAKDFVIGAGGKEVIKAKLEPVAAAQGKDPDRRAAEWVLGKGGSVAIFVDGQERGVKGIAELPKESFEVVMVELPGNTSVDDGVFEHLRELTSLGTLVLNGTRVTGRGIEGLQSAKVLTAVYFDRTRVTDAEMAHLKELTNLATLFLNGTQVGDAGLAHIQGLPLGRLDARWTRVTGNGLAKLKGMRSLGIGGNTQVNDATLEELTGLTKLERIGLEHTTVTDNGLKHLVRFPRLSLVVLQGTPVTDKGLENLKPLRNLTGLDLQDTKVTAAGVAALQAALPKCKITVSPAIQAELDKLKKPSPATGATDPDRRAAQWVLGKGGTLVITVGSQEREVKAITELPSSGFKVVSVTLADNTSIDDEVFEHLRELTSLGGLFLQRTRVTGRGIERLQSAKVLGFLTLDHTQVTDAGMAHLHELTNLTSVRLLGTQVSDAGLAQLQGLPVLFIDVAWTGVTCNGLAKFKNLKRLAIGGGNPQVTDDGLLELTGLTRLEVIGLYATSVTDNGLKHLARFPNLKGVVLQYTPVTDKGLENLKALPALAGLDLRDTKVTANGVAAVQAALPNCKITVSPEVDKALGRGQKKN